MSDFFNEALKGGLDSLTADQLDELIIMAQAKRSESKGKKGSVATARLAYSAFLIALEIIIPNKPVC